MSVNKQNGIGLAGGVVGIVNVSMSFILSWFFAPLFVLSSVVVVVLSAVGLKKAKENGTPAGWAITGLATGIPTLAWNLFWSFLLIVAYLSNTQY